MKKMRKPIRDVKNFGPVCATEFEAMGINYLDQIEKMGFEETCRLWIQYFPDRLNANAFLGIACSLDGVVWTKASSEHRVLAHAMVKLLRQEYGLPPAKRKRVKT